MTVLKEEKRKWRTKIFDKDDIRLSTFTDAEKMKSFPQSPVDNTALKDKTPWIEVGQPTQDKADSAWDNTPGQLTWIPAEPDLIKKVLSVILMRRLVSTDISLSALCLAAVVVNAR